MYPCCYFLKVSPSLFFGVIINIIINNIKLRPNSQIVIPADNTTEATNFECEFQIASNAALYTKYLPGNVFEQIKLIKFPTKAHDIPVIITGAKVSVFLFEFIVLLDEMITAHTNAIGKASHSATTPSINTVSKTICNANDKKASTGPHSAAI